MMNINQEKIEIILKKWINNSNLVNFLLEENKIMKGNDNYNNNSNEYVNYEEKENMNNKQYY